MSGLVKRDAGIMQGTGYNKQSLRANLSQTFGTRLSLGAFRIEERKSATQIVGLKNVGTTAAGEDSIIVTKVGDAAPDFQMSFTNELTYRGWRLSGLVDWKQGGDITNLTQFLYDAAGNSPDYGDSETSPARVRAARFAAGNTDAYVQDGSYVTVREIALSYEIPTGLTGRLFNGAVRSARAELSGRNLVTFTDYPGLDPEVSNLPAAQADVNTIRVKSGGLAPRSYASIDEALTDLLRQKRYSLLFESGSRWVDARLYGPLATLPIDPTPTPPPHRVHPNFPVPQDEVNARGGSVA